MITQSVVLISFYHYHTVVLNSLTDQIDCVEAFDKNVMQKQPFYDQSKVIVYIHNPCLILSTLTN